jgi:hypothetical protein
MIRAQIEGLRDGLTRLGWYVGSDEPGNETLQSPMEARITVDGAEALDATERPGWLMSVEVTVDLRIRRTEGLEGYLDALERVEDALTAITTLQSAPTGRVRVNRIEMTRGGDYRGAAVRLSIITAA